MVFVCKIRLKYSKELFDYKVKNTKTHIIIVKISHGVLRFLIPQGILFHRTSLWMSVEVLSFKKQGFFIPSGGSF